MVLSTIIDISERQRAAERERLLVREIRHRSGNLFAVTKAVVAQSLSGDPRLVQAQKEIVSRLEAMSRTHRLLVDAEWNRLDLKEIVRAEPEAFADQVEITGSNIIMGPSDVQNFSLAVHELTTNAAKYGALSVAAGRVDVSWSTTRDGGASLLRFRWRERNGPSVVAPSRNGFESSLLRSVFPEAHLDYKPETPLRHGPRESFYTGSAHRGTPAAPHSAHPAQLSDRRR